MISRGQRRRRQMPLEMQGRFIQTGAADPIRRSGEIKHMFDKVSAQTKPFMEAFGVRVDDDLQVIQGRILPPPTIRFGDNSCIDVEDRETENLSWSMVNQKFFFVDGVLDHWGVLVTACCTVAQVKHFLSAVIKTAGELGIEVKAPIISFGDQATVVEDIIDLHKQVSEAARPNKKLCRMLMVIKPDACTIDYAQIKNVGETYLGIPTQCVVASHVQDTTELYIRNVLLKMNAKLGGVNWSITWDDIEPLRSRMAGNKPKVHGVMVVGIALTHQPARRERQDAESIAAAVGALDPLCNHWITSIRKQEALEAGICDAADMVADLLQGFHAELGYLPASVLVYRVGVSEGQFEDVKAKESAPILSKALQVGKRVLNIPNYKPKLTFVVMQKRHHCRFFPGAKSRRDTTGNCVPGTVVDRTVAHASNFDWYVIAHNACQGTTRPVRYTMLQDDMNFTADEIQKLTYNLCFAFCRSTSPVAEVPAVMYAELLSVRGRAHMSARDMYETMARNGDRSIIDKLPKQLTGRLPLVTKNLKKVMYYV